MYDIDKVFIDPNTGGEIFISGATCALDKQLLKDLKINNVLNAAAGEIHTNSYYYDNRVNFLGIPVSDLPNENISKYFDSTTEFIHKSIKRGEKILVHCAAGISRSSTFVVAYLIKYQNIDLQRALKILKRKRGVVNPNTGFIKQLRLNF